MKAFPDIGTTPKTPFPGLSLRRYCLLPGICVIVTLPGVSLSSSPLAKELRRISHLSDAKLLPVTIFHKLLPSFKGLPFKELDYFQFMVPTIPCPCALLLVL